MMFREKFEEWFQEKGILVIVAAMLVSLAVITMMTLREPRAVYTESETCRVLGKNMIGNRYFVQTWVEVSERDYDALEVGDKMRLVRVAK